MSDNILKFSIANAREQFSELLNLAKYKNTRIEITKRDKTVGFIISQNDFELLERLEDYLDAKDADEILAQGKQAISHEELKKELGL